MMRHLVAAIGCLCTVASAPAQMRDVPALQEATRKALDEAEPSIACVLVSRSERYRDFNALSSGTDGKLGGFDPRSLAPFSGDAAKRELIRRLDLANPSPLPESYGSGVVIDAAGLVLTNFHVVQNATKIYVRLPNRKGSYADIHAADGRSDLAVLKLIDPIEGLKPMRLGNGGLVRERDFVLGLANPFTAEGRDWRPIASNGSIVKVRWKASRGESGYVDSRNLLQTDLRLNLACSGGAVLNLEGELVGLTTSMAAIVGGESSGGFATPLSAGIKRVIDVLKRGEEVEYGFLGISVGQIDAGGGRGAVIEAVNDGTPARRAGLLPGELITAIGGEPIKNNDDLLLNTGLVLAGNEVTITVGFGGRERKLTARLAKFPYAIPFIASKRPPSVHGLHIDFSSMVGAALALPEGVVIRDVEPGSAAERKYKELLDSSRWIITAVNGKAVLYPGDFYRETAAVKGPLELKIVEAVRNAESTARTLVLP
jgi:serine protease Do